MDTTAYMDAFLKDLIDQRLRSYEAEPGRLKEDAGREATVLAGGYGYRQILELVQNGADALIEQREQDGVQADAGRIHVRLHDRHLYVANTGAPFTKEGLVTLLSSDVSTKRGNQIGRFGLGFKSLLKLGGRIDVFTRRSGAIRFDPERCHAELCDRFKVQTAPRLRLAWFLDEEERAADPILGELSWAETVVRAAIFSDDLLGPLRNELLAFPAEFLLFFPIPTVLTLESDAQAPREISLKDDGQDRVLHDGSTSTRWRLAQREVRICDRRALDDATHIHGRESVPVAWAMPIEGRREEKGRFWAFFPTKTQTYLPGIVNAPWKLNSDRNAIIGGEWNRVLMTEAAALIAENLSGLASPDEPARPLDAFPRQMVGKDEDAAPLVEALWERLETSAVIADAAGTLRAASEVRRHPWDAPKFAEEWRALSKQSELHQLVHPGCLEGQRASRLNALATRLEAKAPGGIPAPLSRCSAADWFARIASTRTDAGMDVLRLAQSLSEGVKSGEWYLIRPTLAIIPTASGRLVTADQAVLASEGISVPGRESVAMELQSNEAACRILADVLKVREPDEQLWIQVLEKTLSALKRSGSVNDTDWNGFWSQLRGAPEGARKRFLERHKGEVLVRRRDGQWVRADAALLPGRLVDGVDTSTNAGILVDHTTHDKDVTSLDRLGTVDLPMGDIGPDIYSVISSKSRFLGEWLSSCKDRYKREHSNSASRSYLEPIGLVMPRSFALLEKLSGMSSARFTSHLLKRVEEPKFRDTIGFGHATTKAYPKIDVLHPLSSFLLACGKVQLGTQHVVSLKSIFARRDEPTLAGLLSDPSVEPALALLQESDLFPLVPDKVELTELWRSAFEACSTADAVARGELLDLWRAAAKDGVVPVELPGPDGAVRLNDVFVTASPNLARLARENHHTVAVLDDDTMRLWLNKGASELADLIEPGWDETEGPLERLAEVVPEFHNVLRADIRDSLGCQRVKGLRLRIGDAGKAVSCLVWKGALYLDVGTLKDVPRQSRLRRLLAEVASAGWLVESEDVALKRVADADVDKRRAHVARGETLAERLLRAVGDRVDPLLETLGDALRQQDFIRECSSQQLAELVLAQFGPSALYGLRETLRDEGLRPPERWTTAATVAFVTSIGFPAEFASSAQARREAEEFVSGPIELKKLHDFQQEVFDGLSELLASSTQRRRAVVSLPTGGGKTRVAVETAVRLVLAPEDRRRSVLWIAQTDELCEQAVQAFRQVWVNFGAQRTDLRIVRLWGGNANPAAPEIGKPTVVIASIQTLNNRFADDEMAWLSTPGLVVLDECHHAITPSYTALLRWLDAEAPRPGVPVKDEPPIVGLSATPFRMGEDESRRLARRFDERWLPRNQENLYLRLRDQGVLAHPNYESLESGSRFTEDELSRLDRVGLAWEGLEFENLLEEINQRLATDSQRNELLVQCIEASDERSILFFANSVAHATEMAARLNLLGIGAAAISGETPPATRRWFLQRFQTGELRVLCNHSVLTTGFDAPKTDMILIARQVFSPVRYMQMVGRGLRGEQNGGTHSCRVVTVMDNLGRFQSKHPYHYCQKHFSIPDDTV